MASCISLVGVPRNCSSAALRTCSFERTLTCATPVTVKATPCAVSTFSQRGFSVMTSRERLEGKKEGGDAHYISSLFEAVARVACLCTSETHEHANPQSPIRIRFFDGVQQPPAR